MRSQLAILLLLAVGCGPATQPATERAVSPVARREPVPAVAPAAEPAPQPPAEPVAEAGTWFRVGDYEIRLADAFLDYYSGFDANGKPHPPNPNPPLRMKIEVRNPSETRKLNWAGFDRARCVVRDEFGNRYAGGDGIAVHEFDQGTSLYPGKEETIPLGFERPVPKATRFTLDLPTDLLGRPGKVTVRFTAAFVRGFSRK